MSENNKQEKKPKAVVVGGSIAGLSCAHALLAAGWDVVVLEKAGAPLTGNPTGAGLGLDPLAQQLIESWLGHLSHRFSQLSLPLTIDQNQVIDAENNVIRILSRDETYNYRAAYWADLHSLLYNALPPNVISWGHLFLSFCTSHDKSSVQVKAKVLQTSDVVTVSSDLLVAADGCLSSVRHSFLPDLKLRYSGYCAWRGVLDFSNGEYSEAICELKKRYPDLGKCVYFDLGLGTHNLLIELPNKRINWLWYTNQPEPELKGKSMTMKVLPDMVKKMHEEAEKVWVPELARIIKETKEPFLNFIYDCDPLQQIFWDNVVLIGDAAHPTTPHGARSTNMGIVDAAVLGKCLEKWGVENLHLALEEYQYIRQPVTSKQVLHSRQLGRIKQGLALGDREPFDPRSASFEDVQELQTMKMPFFDNVPSILMLN